VCAFQGLEEVATEQQETFFLVKRNKNTFEMQLQAGAVQTALSASKPHKGNSL
jgi:hypothetical protein